MIVNMSRILNRCNKFIAVTLVVTMIMTMGMINSYAGNYVDDLYLKYNGGIYKYQNRLVTLEIDGKVLQTGDMPAIIVENTTMVPVREFFESEAIGATVNWNGATNEVYISYLDQFVVLKIDATTAKVNNEIIELIVPAMLIQEKSKQYPKTMLPLRFVSENLGFDVGWEQESYTASIDTSKVILKENIKETVETAPIGNDTSVDPKVVSGEQLDKLEGSKANRELPTALLNNPIVFNAVGDIEVGLEDSYAESSIAFEEHDLVYIDYVNYVEDGEKKGFEIDATGKITNVSTHVWDGKFIIEIYNSKLDLDKVIDYPDNEIVTSVRMGEHVDNDGQPYSKIVFDLRSTGYKFNLTLSENREKLYVEAVNNAIYGVELKQNDSGDFIDVTGVHASNIETFRLSNPSRIVFDMPNTKTLLGYQSAESEGQYVTAIRTAQFEATTFRIVVETDGQPDYQVLEINDTTTRIQIFEPTYENITYDNTEDTPTIVIKKQEDETLTINNITYEDNYLDRESIITLPGDYMSYFGSGDVKINDAVIDNISFKLNSEGNTEVVIKSNTVQEYRIEEVDNGLKIKAYKPTELYSKVIVIDPGHGGKDPGAIIGPYHEADINLAITLELEKLLAQDPSIKVYYTRSHDVYPTLEDRAVLANEVEADIFISIHCNSFISSYRGTETLFLPGPDTTGLNAFEVAEIFQKVFTDHTALDDYKMKERDNLYVLKYTDMPAIILEMGYLSNEYDRSYLTNPDYYDDLAKGIQASINKVFLQYPTGR